MNLCQKFGMFCRCLEYYEYHICYANVSLAEYSKKFTNNTMDIVIGYDKIDEKGGNCIMVGGFEDYEKFRMQKKIFEKKFDSDTLEKELVDYVEQQIKKYELIKLTE